MINENLYTLRKINNMSQEQVAEKINVSRQAVAKWEKGETVPDIYNCMALSELFGVSVDDFLHYNERDKGIPIGPKGKHIFGTVVIGERGQIVIPKRARKIFNLEPGDELVVLGDEEQGIALMKANVMMKAFESVRKLAGKKEEE